MVSVNDIREFISETSDMQLDALKRWIKEETDKRTVAKEERHKEEFLTVLENIKNDGCRVFFSSEDGNEHDLMSAPTSCFEVNFFDW